MSNFAITITRTCGSGGTSVAKKLSEDLGISIYDRKLLQLASEDSGINEKIFAKADEDMKRKTLFKVSKRVYKGGLIPPESDDFTSNDNLFNYQAKVLNELLEEESYVVIGRAADFVLKDYDHVVRVFIHASSEKCIEHEMEWLRCDEKTAKITINRLNAYRNAYYKYHTGNEWEDVKNYDIILDTSKYTFDECAKIIEEYLKTKQTILSLRR